jgi:transposase-like protein
VRLVELVVEHGTLSAVATHLGMPNQSLAGHVRRRRSENPLIDKQIDDARKLAKVSKARSQLDSRGSISWPSDDELTLAVQTMSVRELADQIGCAEPTLRYRLRRQQIDLPSANRQRVETQLDAEISEADLLRRRNAELEKVARNARKEDVETEALIRRLEAALPQATARYVAPPARPRRQAAAADDQHEAILLFSDTHAGETVTREETLGLNEYNWQVMLDRMARLQDRVLSFVAHRPYPIRKLHVWLLGDMLSGSIHEELARTNEMADAQATVQFATDCAAWLEGFAEHFDEIDVAGVPGNHPRRSRKPSAKQAANNDDWIAYKIVELLMRGDERYSFDFPAASFVMRTVAQRWRFLIMHGDGIRSSMPGVPWGGVVRRITVLEQQFSAAKTPIDYVALGHFHTANAIDGVSVRTFLNGSTKGVDEYSLKAFGSGRAPTQLLLTCHPRRGITDISILDLEDHHPAGLSKADVDAQT